MQKVNEMIGGEVKKKDDHLLCTLRVKQKPNTENKNEACSGSQ